MSKNRGFRRGKGGQDNVGARDARENWKVFENCLWFNPICAKHTIFTTGLTCKQVVKMSRQNPFNKILKIWSKCFLQLEGPLVSKLRGESWILLCKLVTGASTRDQVAKLSCENAKNSEILKYFLSIFCDWGIDSPESHESFCVSLRLGSCD